MYFFIYAAGFHFANLDETVIEFFGEGRFLIVAGYLDGSYRIYRTDNCSQIAIGKVSAGQITKMMVT